MQEPTERPPKCCGACPPTARGGYDWHLPRQPTMPEQPGHIRVDGILAHSNNRRNPFGGLVGSTPTYGTQALRNPPAWLDLAKPKPLTLSGVRARRRIDPRRGGPFSYPPTGGDPMRTCSIEDCNRSHRAKGLCCTHYNQQMPNRYKLVEIQCHWCGKAQMKQRTLGRYSKTYCGLPCRDAGRRGYDGLEELPEDHWARWYGKTSEWKPLEVKPRFQLGACAECGDPICEPTGQTPSTYCSERCSDRIRRRRRRAREHNAPGEFTFTQVMRQYLRQGKVCAYCKSPCVGLPDPEHVTPLSRGGRNDMSNIVAACRTCNTDKNDLTLEEWAADRERRALPPVDTKLESAEYQNLWRTAPTAPAWRDRGLVAA